MCGESCVCTCVCVCLCLAVCVCMWVYVSVCLCVSLCVSHNVYVSLSVCMSLSVCVSQCGFLLSVNVCLSQCVYVSLSVCVSLCVCLCLTLTVSVCKEPPYQCRRQKRCTLNPWVVKTPWRRAQQPIPVFILSRKNPMDRGAWQAIVHSSQSDTAEVTEQQQQQDGHNHLFISTGGFSHIQTNALVRFSIQATTRCSIL